MSVTYDKWMETGESTLEDELNLVLKTFPNPCRILDVGCGTGRISLPLQELGYAVVGVDISQGMINEARRKGLRNATVCDLLEYTHSGQPFDGITSLHMGFSYVNDTETMRRMLEKCKGHLTEGGKIIWDTPNRGFYGEERVLEWPAGDEIVKTICYGHNIEELEKLFEEIGFEVKRVWGSYSPLQDFDDRLPRIIILGENNAR